MARQNNSDKTTFKVKFLGEYHDMVIDWNDDKYEYKEQQVFEQLASLTGIPAKYKLSLYLFARRPLRQNDFPNMGINCLSIRNITHFPPNSNPNNSAFVKYNIHDVCIEDNERFHLKFYPFYYFLSMKRLGISYELIPETRVQNGVCSNNFCHHMTSKSYFNKVKDLVCNDDLNLQISHRVKSIMQGEHISWFRETDKVFREFNVQQFLRNECNASYINRIEDGYIGQEELYLRMRG